MQQSNKGLIAFLLVPIVFIGAMFGFLLLLTGGPAAALCEPSGGAMMVDENTVPADPVAGYEHDQLVNAAHIMNAAHTLGLSAHAQQIGVMTAMGESSLRVLDYGDQAGPDSRGLFQQRDSWGALAERMDPFTSATFFFKRLKTIPEWETLEPTIAAHKVQANADPYHYEKFWDPAGHVFTALSGTTATPHSACGSGGLGFPLDKPFNMTDTFGPRSSPVAGASSYHPAVDLQNWPNPCGQPIYAIQPGTVVLSDRLYLSIKTPDGYTISYLHSHTPDRLVKTGDTVTTGQKIALVGNEAPSTGCHLDLRINTTGNTNPQVAVLPSDPNAPGWVDPEKFYELFGLTLCDDTCHRNY
jgi:murein DD-endopeptidase MepM/ murein hydrolase activator NlpD